MNVRGERKRSHMKMMTMDIEDSQDAIHRFRENDYPRIAVSVGMLDTGFDCPEVVNIRFAQILTIFSRDCLTLSRRQC